MSSETFPASFSAKQVNVPVSSALHNIKQTYQVATVNKGKFTMVWQASVNKTDLTIGLARQCE